MFLLLIILYLYYFIIDLIHNETSLIIKYLKTEPYVTSLVMYKDKTTPRTDFPNYFNCSLIVGQFRFCEFHSDLHFSRFWGSIYSRVCAREVDDPTEDCTTYKLMFVKFISPLNVTFSRLPPTSGGDIVINGTFLRVLGGPNTLEFSSWEEDGRFVVKGNFSDPSFNCNSITVTIPPGGGLFTVIFGDYGGGEYDISYEPPTNFKYYP
ncbi:hypothetical protein ACTFIY_008654 [Dictyostelium cf. discoideum]